MKTHAVPHDIMGVEFKLFGNFMSLREFIYVAVSIAVAYFFYILKQNNIIPGILAWPAILLLGGGGVIMGLVPYQDRTLDQWLINYFVAIKSPTQRIWSKPGFEPTQTSDNQTVIKKHHVINSPAHGGQTQSGTQSQTGTQPSDIDKNEDQQLDQITKILEQVEKQLDTNTVQPSQQKSETIPRTSDSPKVTASPQPTPQPVTTPKPIVTQQPTVIPKPTVTPQPIPKPQAKPVLAEPALTVKRPSGVPPKPTATKKNIPISRQLANLPEPQNPSESTVIITEKNINDYATKVAGIKEQKNTVNMAVKDQAGKIIQGVTCITKNAEGKPVRASVSNQLGHIINNIPLQNGKYNITLSKQGYKFPQIDLTLKDTIIPTLDIKAL